MSSISLSPSITQCQVIDPMSIPGKYITPIKVARVALYALSAVPMLIGGATFIAAVSGIVTWPLALLSIPCLAISAGIISWGRSLNDYSDPREVQKMRNQALGLSFSDAVSKHGFTLRRGLNNIVKHYILPHEHIQSMFIHENRFVSFSDLIRKYPLSIIRGYDLMPINLLRKTFFCELQGLDIEQVVNRFTILELFQYSLFPRETIGSVSNLCRRAQDQIASYNEQRRALDHKYPYRQERILLQLDADERQACVNGVWRSMEMQSSARSLGQLSTSFAVSSIQGTGNPSVDTERRRSIQNQGTIITELGAVPLARGISRALLNQDLERIDEQRRAVILQGVGQTQQSLYQCELSRLDEIHGSQLAQLDQKFEGIKSWLNRLIKA